MTMEITRLNLRSALTAFNKFDYRTCYLFCCAPLCDRKQTQTEDALLSQVVIESMRFLSSNQRPGSINRSKDN